ncbi:glucosaminidase domain-containing protein [Paenibacillus sp. IB182496]|uniref:Glucosaminidase domain-containing protein n=1 Tax=Paenibacillus sabuli TaxID=2772509 RepID=A0A927BTX9_9BACL|nr:glucosaminidase domain-containing protein [Paenibacillus sabuli]MBD2846247.1 glucosaminidase domain-containing protein [Paenibacillus sabuli]
MTREAFIATLAPYAIQARIEGSPLLASVRLAQNVLETGGVLPQTNNLGGYKAGDGKPTAHWNGQVANKSTWEVINGKRVETTAAFRVYESIAAFYKDQDLLLRQPRYQAVRSARTPESQATALQQSGYATDPAYASKLKALIHHYQLERFDARVEEELRMAQETRMEQQLDAVGRQLEELKRSLEQLDRRTRQIEAPAWAAAAAAHFDAYIDTPKGSYDFWRLLTVLYRQQAGGAGE